MKSLKIFSPANLAITISVLLILLGSLRAYSTIIAPKYSPSGDEAQHAMVDQTRLYLFILDVASIGLGIGLLTNKKRLVAKITFWFASAMLTLIAGFRLSVYLLFLVIAPNFLFFEGATGFYNMIDTILVTFGLLIIVVLLRLKSVRNHINN